MARFNGPRDLVFDSQGNLFIADTFNRRVRRVDSITSIIATVAGGGALAGKLSDGMDPTDALLGFIEGLAIDQDDNLLIADKDNNRIRKVDFASGLISTIAGGGNPSDGVGDGGPALEAGLDNPLDVLVTPQGDLFIADRDHFRVRRVDGLTGSISTIAGTGLQSGLLGDGGPATAARLTPFRLAIDPRGNLLIAEQVRVRRVDAATGIISTVAGNGSSDSTGDASPATEAGLRVSSILLDGAGNLYIGDVAGINRVRIVRSPF